MPRYIHLPKFDVAAPNAILQADLLFLPHDNLPRGRKIFKYALTVVNVASRYKESEPLISKDSACRSRESFSVHLQAHSFDVASAVANGPWARVHGKRDQRNGKPQNRYSSRTPEIHGDKGIVAFQLHGRLALVWSSVFSGNASPSEKVERLGEKALRRSCRS